MKKKASTPGQDLRTPALGGTKFPTDDSVEPARKRLRQSTPEFGPMPFPSSKGATLDDAVAVPKPKWASIGDPMDPMLDDPLVLYLKKQAAKDTAKEPPPLTDLVEGSQLKDNLDNMPLGKEEFERTSLSPQSTMRMKDKGKSETYSTIEEMFSNEQAMRRKFQDKDHPSEEFDQGVVNRILGL